MTRSPLKQQRHLNLRGITDEDVERLDSLAECVSFTSRTAVGIAALRLGMAALEKDLTLLVSDAAHASRRNARKRP